jgi:hypothetical protein
MRTSMIVYRLFDVADEINLEQVQALWITRNAIVSRLRLDRISTKSITFANPPILVELGSHDMEFCGKTYVVEVKARIQDLGVICLIFNIAFDEDVTYKEYMDVVLATDEMPDEKVRGFLDTVLETIKPACTNERVSEFDEDFVVYYFQDPVPQDWDLVPILLSDVNPVSEETRKYTLANRFSYASDYAYLAWDSAVVYDASGSMDIPDLLEFASAQFLELRYYDNYLNKAIDKTYGEIEAVSKSDEASKLERYRSIRGSLLETMADVSSLTSNITNALQVTEDIFYARVYTRYMELLRASVWQENIDNKLNVIQRSYNLLNEEITAHRLTMLGYGIIGILILVLIVLVFLTFK